jgi:uncharacterized glyoxalase superfamily protein PhnB
MKMEATVDVDVEPDTAFEVFAGEIDQWWGNGPIDAWSFTRTVARRIEPGVGGRVLEVYEDDVLELARVTRWEPGRRLTWESSIDDVTIDVHFDATDTGTRVRVEGHVPEGGRGQAGLSFVRMAPQWLPRYLERGRRPWPVLDRLAVVVRSPEPAETARWLCAAFGFEPAADIVEATPADHSWFDLRLGPSGVVVLHGEAPSEPSRQTEALVFVEDVEAHLARAQEAGAVVVQPVRDHGFASYEAEDRDGRRWMFAQAGGRQRAARAAAG